MNNYIAKKRHCTLVFGDLNYHNQIPSKDYAEVTPTDVYIRSRSVPRAIYALTHTCWCNIYYSVGISLFVLMGRLW